MALPGDNMSLFCLSDIVIAGGQKVLMEVTGSSVLNFNQSSHEIGQCHNLS